MKKRALPLLLAVLLCLTGCGSFLQREWYEVKDHSSSYYEGSGRGVLQADTYQDLVNDILLLVGNHTEEGTIRLYYGGEGLDATDAAEMACREVEHDTPLGSYAVEYLQYTLDDSARNYSEITVTISYRCTAQQMASIAHVTNTSALRDVLAQAQDEGLTELVVQLGLGCALHPPPPTPPADIERLIREVESSAGGADWLVRFYPDRDSVGLVEILLVH